MLLVRLLHAVVVLCAVVVGTVWAPQGEALAGVNFLLMAGLIGAAALGYLLVRQQYRGVLDPPAVMATGCYAVSVGVAVLSDNLVARFIAGALCLIVIAQQWPQSDDAAQ